jgi:hypothetical protein
MRSHSSELSEGCKEAMAQANASQSESDTNAVPLTPDHEERSSLGSATTIVPMVPEGGTFLVPVRINDQITLKFAADVSVPADVVMTLLRADTISDFLGNQTYRLTNGTTIPSQRFVIRSLKVGDRTLRNVVGSIAPVEGSMLLGQSFLRRFKSWSIDNQRGALILK